MAGKCEYFYRLRAQGLLSAAKSLLKENPPPKNWQHSAWRWAFENLQMAREASNHEDN